MELIFPAIEHKEAALAYKQEHFDNGETMIHGDGGLDYTENYEDWLLKLDADLTREGDDVVPAVTYFGMVDGKIVGAINIRYRINERLALYGGHIGYGIRPSERRKGYASEMLRLALIKCRELGIERALVTCNKENIGSARTILKNGGVFEDEIENDGFVTQRYWIAIG
jgi:predicted acetyltransferase